jgi:methionyl-tRNA synthetase
MKLYESEVDKMELPQILSNPAVYFTIITWSIIWKGLALWRAARLKQPGWFIALLIINTVGIFEIIYLLVTNKKYKEINQ